MVLLSIPLVTEIWRSYELSCKKIVDPHLFFFKTSIKIHNTKNYNQLNYVSVSQECRSWVGNCPTTYLLALYSKVLFVHPIFLSGGKIFGLPISFLHTCSWWIYAWWCHLSIYDDRAAFQGCFIRDWFKVRWGRYLFSFCQTANDPKILAVKDEVVGLRKERMDNILQGKL